MMYCDDGLLADMPPPAPPAPTQGREPWKPAAVTLCRRCGQVGWKHRSFPPVLADEMDRAIFAAAFVRGLDFSDAKVRDPEAVIEAARTAVRFAETVVELHRSARAGK